MSLRSQRDAFFKKLDRKILQMSPRGDVFLLRLIAAVIPVICFAADAVYRLPFFYWLGLPFYLGCLALYAYGLLKSLAQGQVSAELLIVLVMVVTLMDGKPLSGALVAWFIGLGLYVSFTIIRRNREKIEGMVKRSRQTALILEQGALREVAVAEVRRGDGVIVPKGTMVPVDGVIAEGESSIDEAFVTGEPFPVYKVAGDRVISGTLNLKAPLQIEAACDGNDSFLAVIASQIEASLEQKSSMQKKADRIVQYLLLGVTGYSFLLFFVTGSLDLMATALSVICPCAWALATPTVFAAGIGRSARLNILARGGEPLEIMQEVKTVVLDKTGTVTRGEPRVDRVVAMGMEEPELLEIAASVEARFSHPIARAVLSHARERGVARLRPVEQAEDLPGRGVKARVEEHDVVIGSPETLRALGIETPEMEHQGRAVWVAVDGRTQGAIVIQDVMTAETKDLAAAFRSCGVERVVLATGDHEESEARRVADLIGVDAYHFNFKPQDKADLVRTLQAEGKVAMVGDGVNDAPALAAADVGIAVSGHKNISLSIASADIVILGDDAGDVLTVLKLSRKMGEIIKQNYTWAMGFNAVGLTLATLGVLNPVLAAFLHHISSIFVVANAGRLYVGLDRPADVIDFLFRRPGSIQRDLPRALGEEA